MTTSKHGTAKWMHVHRCPQCGHTVEVEEISHSAIATGVMICPKFEYSGPINLQIVSEDGATP
jgi:hypothetical protein